MQRNRRAMYKEKTANLNYLTTKTIEAYEEYKKTCSHTKAPVRRIKNVYWEMFAERMKHINGLQKQKCRLNRNKK